MKALLIVNLIVSLQAYSNLLRAHMDGLKKKDKKSKSKKTKATQWIIQTLQQNHGDLNWPELPEGMRKTFVSRLTWISSLRHQNPCSTTQWFVWYYAIVFMVISYTGLVSAIGDLEQKLRLSHLIQDEVITFI